LLQASQQVQQAWANVKGKEPLNKRASNLASSNSNAADHLQRQPDSSNSDAAHRSANNTERQQSRRDSRDSIPANAQAHNADQRDSAGNSGGGSFAGQSGLNGGQLAAALSESARQGLNASSSQMPFAGQGTASPCKTIIHGYITFFCGELLRSAAPKVFTTPSLPAEGTCIVLSPEHMLPVVFTAKKADCVTHNASSNQMVTCTCFPPLHPQSMQIGTKLLQTLAKVLVCQVQSAGKMPYSKTFILTNCVMSPAALAGLAEAANGSAMLAARQAAAAQLEQFRAEMVAEAAKMRAAVERQVLAPKS